MSFLVRIVALSLCACVSLSAQSSSGGGVLEGSVKDSAGAAIAGAKVLVRQIETGRTFNTAANSEGLFTTPSLAIGKYKVRVEAAGMKALEEEILIETGKTATVEAILQVGAVSETVTVASTVPLVQTTDPTDGSTLDSQRIKELPINGRDLNTLLSSVAPGVEPVIDVNGGVRTGGLMVYSTNYVQDGALSNNREFGGSMNLQGLESIGEVRVETSTSSAKYSAPTSIIVNSKGGTNKLRGSLYETARNNAFGVARARQDINLNGQPYQVPKLIRNEFGGSIGGPIVIPGLGGKTIYNGRNKSFFFFSKEGTELRQGLTREFTVPMTQWRRGDFSNLYDSQGRFIQLYDPLTTSLQELPNGRKVAVRAPFQNNQIPLQRMSPLAKYIYGITPDPTDITNPLVTNNYKIAVPTNGNPNLSDNPTTIRLDHRFSEKDNAFFKVNGGRRSAYFLGTASNNGAPTRNNEANVTYLPMEAIAASISWNHVFTPMFFAETLISHTWQSTKTVTGPEQKNWAKELGLPNSFGEVGWPNITSLQTMNYIEGDNRRSLRSRTINLEQNYTWIKGRHNLQFGGRFMRYDDYLLPDQGAISGSVAFNSLGTALESPTLGNANQPQAVPQTGNDAANFFLGSASTYTIGLKRGILSLKDRNYGFYVQDNYRVNRRLTLNFGVRWDIAPAIIEKNGLLNTFDADSHSLVFPENLDYYLKRGDTTPAVIKLFQDVGVKFNSAASLNLPRNPFPSNLFNIGPRGGFAWTAGHADRPWVIRGGYGMYLSPIPMRSLLAQFSSLAPFRANFSYNPNSAAQSPDGIQNYLLRTPQTLVAGQNTPDSIVDLNSPTSISRGQAVIGLAKDLPPLRIHEYNIVIEKQVSQTMVLRLRYNGKYGVNADQLYNINPQLSDYNWYRSTGEIIPTGSFSNVARRVYDQQAYTNVLLLTKTGKIGTQLFTLEAERRFSKGMGFQVFYTLTNALRLAGNTFRDDGISALGGYYPGSVPTDFNQLNKFLNYDRDTAIPQHRFRFNYNYDLPFGRGKMLFKNPPKALNALISGWKLSGSGTMLSTWYALPTTNWGVQNDFQVFGTKYPILDCRQTPTTATNPADERCVQGYYWYNGYISNRFINSRNAAGLRNGVYGLPEGVKPVQSPIVPWPVGGQTTDPRANDYDTNAAYITLKSGSTVRVGTADTSLHPLRNQYALGPFNWLTDASLLKFFNFTESGRVRLRVNADLFNVFNRQGLNVPGADGVVSLASSYGGSGFRPRQLQLTMRLEF